MDILHTANNAINILNEGLMKIRIEERTRNRQIFRIPRFTDYSAAVFYALCAILCLGNFLHVQALTPKGELLMEHKPVHDFLYHLEMARLYETGQRH